MACPPRLLALPLPLPLLVVVARVVMMVRLVQGMGPGLVPQLRRSQQRVGDRQERRVVLQSLRHMIGRR